MLNLSVSDRIWSLSQDCYGIVKSICGDKITVFFCDSYVATVLKNDLYWNEIKPQLNALEKE